MSEIQTVTDRMLGRKPPKIDPRNLLLEKYLDPALPAPPVTGGWTKKVTVPYGFMLNDREGICTIASAGHQEMIWTANASQVYVPPDADIQAAYVAVTGEEGAAFDPATGANDNGCAILDVCNFWKNVGISGHRIAAHLAVNPRHAQHVLQSVAIFGGLQIGVWLPITSQRQTYWNVVWQNGHQLSGDSAPGSWGGHAIPVVGWAPYGLCVVTWGQLVWMSWSFFAAYCDEAHVCLSADWIMADGKAPSGFDYAALSRDMMYVTGRPLSLKRSRK